jgi:hypothetical protein
MKVSSKNCQSPSEHFDVNTPAKGVTVQDNGQNWPIEISHRSLLALFLVPFSFAWVIGIVYALYDFGLPANLIHGLLIIFFTIACCFVTWLALSTLFGRTVVSVEFGKAMIFKGLVD